MRTLVKTKFGLPAESRFFFDDLFRKEFFGGKPYHTVKSTPEVNVKEGEKEYVLEIAAPGLQKEDFSIQLEGGVLSISAATKEEESEPDERSQYTRKEFSYHSFKRSFSIDEERVDGEHISAKYENGVLTVQIPKKVKTEEEKKAKIISIL